MNIIENEKQIDITDINNLEEEFDIVFPENLKKLYLKYNGGIEETGEEIIDQFYSIKHGKTKIELVRDLMQITENNIPLNYLIFGATGVGHQISININDGTIVLFKKDRLESEIIADSLEALLSINSLEDI